MTIVRKLVFLLLTFAIIQLSPAFGQAPAAPPPHKYHVLVIAEAKGWQHDSIPDAMVAIYELGSQSGLWDTVLRTDSDLLTFRDIPLNGKNLAYFDVVVFASTSGDMTLSDDQKKDLLTFIHDMGRGFVGIHGALDTNFAWPEYGKMLGGYFDQHPWETFNAPIRNEQPDFPIVRHFPAQFHKWDEIYQPKDWSRADVDVLLSLDPSQLDLSAPKVHRTDHDFAVAWVKHYGKGRVFYSSLGHTPESWKDPDIRTMYFEVIKWALGMTDGEVATHPMPPSRLEGQSTR
ncbi:MAG: ThuA domain-containing protein [Terracidiphilus sp.]